MSDDTNVTNLLRFTGPLPPEQAARLERPEVEKKPYLAAEIDRTGARVPRLRVHYSNGDISVIAYGYIMEAVSVAPENDQESEYVSLICTTGAVVMRGKGIRALLDALQDETVRALVPFDPTRHEAPDDSAPVIDNIEYQRTGQG